MFFNGPDNSPKLPVHVWDLDPHLIHGSLGPPESPPNGVSRLDQFIRFCTVHQCEQQTYTWRDNATPSVAIDHIYVVHPMPPKTKKETLLWQTRYWPRPPMLSDQSQILHGDSLSGYFRSFKVSLELVR